MKHRLQEILSYYQLTAAEFAKSIGINPSGLSHILSGKRNNLSIDTILKILNKYKDIKLEWLILGKGMMISGDSEANLIFNNENSLFSERNEEALNDNTNCENDKTAKISSITSVENKDINKEYDVLKKVVKVLLIYDDNSFEELKSIN